MYSDDNKPTSLLNTQNHSNDMTSAIFNKANIIFILWFLAIYLVAYLLIGIFFKKTTQPSSPLLFMSRTIDFIILIFLFIFLIIFYVYNSEDKREKIFQKFSGGFYDFLKNPLSILSITFFLILFYTVLYLFSIPTASDTKPSSVYLIETIAWLLFVIILFIDFFSYIMNISLADILSDFFNINIIPSGRFHIPTNGNIYGNISNMPISLTTTSGLVTNKISGNISGNALGFSEPVQKNEVFNVSNNLYTYDDAQAICSAYGAQLANYEQIEDAYNNGAEWCNYGWSDGQMAFFPTQKATWDKLQKTKDHKNDCGRPGINGGYFANPYIKFGVNCYGKKPSPTDADLARMNANSDINIPTTASDAALNSKVEFWKKNADKLLMLNSFDRKHWSEY